MIFSDRVRLEKFIEMPEHHAAFNVSLSWETPSAKGWIGVAEEPASEIEKRIPYPEEKVTSSAKFAEKSISFSGSSPFSFISTLVPLHKALLLKNKVADGNGQWVFTRLDLHGVPKNWKKITVEMDRVLGRQLAKSRVIVDEIFIGAIYFSWLPK